MMRANGLSLSLPFLMEAMAVPYVLTIQARGDKVPGVVDEA